MEYLFELRVEGGEGIAPVGLSIRMTPVGCSEASLCEDAKRMQRSVVMPGEKLLTRVFSAGGRALTVHARERERAAGHLAFCPVPSYFRCADFGMKIKKTEPLRVLRRLARL